MRAIEQLKTTTKGYILLVLQSNLFRFAEEFLLCSMYMFWYQYISLISNCIDLT